MSNFENLFFLMCDWWVLKPSLRPWREGPQRLRHLWSVPPPRKLWEVLQKRMAIMWQRERRSHPLTLLVHEESRPLQRSHPLTPLIWEESRLPSCHHGPMVPRQAHWKWHQHHRTPQEHIPNPQSLPKRQAKCLRHQDKWKKWPRTLLLCQSSKQLCFWRRRAGSPK